MATMTLKEVAKQLGGTLVGNGDIALSQVVHPLQIQSSQDLIMVLDEGMLKALHHPMLKAAVVPEEMPVPEGAIEGYVQVQRPRYALAKLLEIFDKPLHSYKGVHPSAIIDASAKVDPSASVGPFVYVGEKAVVGKNTVLMSHVTVGAEAQVGDDCIFHAGARIGERVVVGSRVFIHHNASIGADGFSYVTPEAGSVESARKSGGKIEAQNTEIVRINSIGTVILEDDVEVGACATIDRSNLGATLIKKGTKVDNLVMIGHNNTIGENCLIVSQTGISGSCKIGDRVVLAGQSGLKDHLTVGDDAILMAKSGAMFDIPAKTIYAGTPAMPHREAFQNFAYLARVKEIHKEMIRMKKRLDELEAGAGITGERESVEV